MPLDFHSVQPSVGNVIVISEDLWEETLYIMSNFNYSIQDLNLCSGTLKYATMWLPLHVQVQYSVFLY